MEQKAAKFKTLEELHAAAVAFAQDPSQRAESAGSADSSYIDDESTRERAMVLLQSWLDSTEDKPIVSEPMKAFLSKPYVMYALLSLVTRAPFLKSDSGPTTASSRRRAKRKGKEAVAVKRSYQAAMLLADGQLPCGALKTEKALKIASALEHGVAKDSGAVLVHVKVVYEFLLQRFPERFPGVSKAFFEALLQRLDEGAAVDLLLVIISGRYATSQVGEVSLKWVLDAVPLFTTLAEGLADHDRNEAASVGCGEVVAQIIEHNLLLRPNLAEPFRDQIFIVFGILLQLCDTSKSVQRKKMAARLLRMLTRTLDQAMIHRQGMEGAAIPNPLYLMREKILNALEGSVTVLVRVMERAGQAQRGDGSVKLSAYEIPQCLTEYRLNMVGTLSALCRYRPKHLESVSASLYRILLDWFFHHLDSTTYCVEFCRIIRTIVLKNDVERLKVLFKKQKLLARIKSVLDDPSTEGRRAFVLYICNLLRVKARTLKPQDYLRQALSTHAAWPSLRLQAERCAEAHCSLPTTSFPKQEHQLVVSPIVPWELCVPAQRSAGRGKSEEVTDVVSDDDYAVALGVTGAAIADTPSKKKKPKRTAAPAAQEENEDLGKKSADGCTSDTSNDATSESSP